MATEGDETWLDLEKLAALIYSELEPNCTVRHDVMLDGVVSETKRQIDVLIEDDHVGSRVVVDCKDHNRKVSVPDAYAFAGLVEDVEATAGILICNKGFSKATMTAAKKKGITLARLHDVSSRKWQLDVQIPIIWTQLWIDDVGLGGRIHLEAGDQIDTNAPPVFLKDGETADVSQVLSSAWNSGALAIAEPGDGSLTATLDVQLANGAIRPDAEIEIRFSVTGAAGLGYVTPQQARGIFDEATGTFATVTFDVGETVKQEPEGGWKPIQDPNELAIRHAGTVLTLREVQHVGPLTMTGVNSIRGAEAHNSQVVWTRDFRA